MLHYGHVKEIHGKHQAYCQCGWKGKKRDSKLTAHNDAIRHEMTVRGPGPYA